MDRWQTFSTLFEGGLVENMSPLQQGEKFPGSLIDCRNFEPSPVGGYRRIQGYAKWDAAQVDGTSATIEASIAFQGKCLAVVNQKLYESAGAGWTLLHTYTNPNGIIQFTKYNYTGTDTIIIVDGANEPLHYDGTTLTPMISGNTVEGTLINASTGTNIFASQAVQEFHRHMFFSKDQFLRFSDVENPGLVDGTAGSGEFKTGSEKVGLAPWREALYCFGEDRIGKVLGNSSADFQYDNVTHKVGVVNPRTIQELSGDVYYLSFDGVRTIAGTDRNDDLELEAVTRQIPKTIEALPFKESGKEVHAVIVRDSSQYRLFVGDGGEADSMAKGLLGGIRLGSQGNLTLEWFKLRAINAASSDSGQHQNVEYVFHGGFDGYVYRQEIGGSFDTGNIDAFFRLPYWTLNDPEIRKVLYKGKVYIDGQAAIEPTLSYLYDYNEAGTIQPPSIPLTSGTAGFSAYGTGIFGTATYGVDFPTITDQNLIGSGDNVSFAISSNDTLDRYSVQSMTIEYGLASRR